eukprot:TRINITY_DN30986_c0_g1_i1.p1 TRINITY_DN30986_c0_g1~~TRINITY_DN30986_c0_g1_i1.p1  ORF type:complete len:1173 (+),score=164.08 TRINITY_DN30986_c0_g1_i1:157-3519(+)
MSEGPLARAQRGVDSISTCCTDDAGEDTTLSSPVFTRYQCWEEIAERVLTPSQPSDLEKSLKVATHNGFGSPAVIAVQGMDFNSKRASPQCNQSQSFAHSAGRHCEDVLPSFAEADDTNAKGRSTPTVSRCIGFQTLPVVGDQEDGGVCTSPRSSRSVCASVVSDVSGTSSPAFPILPTPRLAFQSLVRGTTALPQNPCEHGGCARDAEADIASVPHSGRQKSLQPLVSRTEPVSFSSTPVTSEADPNEANLAQLTRRLLDLVYEQTLDKDVHSAVLASCPEVSWIAQCAVETPLPLGWHLDVSGRYVNGASGETSADMPLMSHFVNMTRLAIQARQTPQNIISIVRLLRSERNEAMRAALSLQEIWTWHRDVMLGVEYFYNSTTGECSWSNPAAALSYVAHVADTLLCAEVFPAGSDLDDKSETTTPRDMAEEFFTARSHCRVLSARGSGGSIATDTRVSDGGGDGDCKEALRNYVIGQSSSGDVADGREEARKKCGCQEERVVRWGSDIGQDSNTLHRYGKDRAATPGSLTVEFISASPYYQALSARGGAGANSKGIGGSSVKAVCTDGDSSSSDSSLPQNAQRNSAIRPCGGNSMRVIGEEGRKECTSQDEWTVRWDSMVGQDSDYFRRIDIVDLDKAAMPKNMGEDLFTPRPHVQALSERGGGGGNGKGANSIRIACGDGDDGGCIVVRGHGIQQRSVARRGSGSSMCASGEEGRHTSTGSSDLGCHNGSWTSEAAPQPSMHRPVAALVHADVSTRSFASDKCGTDCHRLDATSIVAGAARLPIDSHGLDQAKCLNQSRLHKEFTTCSDGERTSPQGGNKKSPSPTAAALADAARAVAAAAAVLADAGWKDEVAVDAGPAAALAGAAAALRVASGVPGSVIEPGRNRCLQNRNDCVSGSGCGGGVGDCGEIDIGVKVNSLDLSSVCKARFLKDLSVSDPCDAAESFARVEGSFCRQSTNMNEESDVGSTVALLAGEVAHFSVFPPSASTLQRPAESVPLPTSPPLSTAILGRPKAVSASLVPASAVGSAPPHVTVLTSSRLTAAPSSSFVQRPSVGTVAGARGGSIGAAKVADGSESASSVRTTPATLSWRPKPRTLERVAQRVSASPIRFAACGA